MPSRDAILKSEVIYDAMVFVPSRGRREEGEEPEPPPDEGPTITSGDAFDFLEGQSALVVVFSVVAEGGDGPITYSLEGGADVAKFTINSGTGAVRFLATPHFIPAGDANEDHVYEIVVGASDGVNPVTTQNVLVTLLQDS